MNTKVSESTQTLHNDLWTSCRTWRIQIVYCLRIRVPSAPREVLHQFAVVTMTSVLYRYRGGF